MAVTVALRGGELAMPSSAALILVANSAGFAVALVMGWKFTRLPLREIFPFRSFNPVILIPLALAAVGGGGLLSEMDTLFRLLPLPAGLRGFMETVDRSVLDMILQSFWPSVVAVVVMAPLTEELFFRGLLLQGFLRRYSTRKALVASACFFALAHLTPNQLIPALLAGVFLAWVVMRTRNLWLSMFTHAVFNSLSAIQVGLMGDSASETLTAKPHFQPWWLDLLFLVILVLGIHWTRAWIRSRYPEPAPYPETTSSAGA